MMCSLALILFLQLPSTPFGNIQTPTISGEVAAYIATLFFGADARTTETFSNTNPASPTMEYCFGVQQYQPAEIITLFGPLANVHAGQPSTVAPVACGASWREALVVLLKKQLTPQLPPAH